MAGKISFIITGGMILEEYDAKSNQYVPKTNSEEILKSISEEISTECLEITEFSMIDSSTVNLEFLQELAKLVQRKVNNPKVSGKNYKSFTNFPYLKKKTTKYVYILKG
jgi:L-asparaginase/Glu-tRNA(Gln) amidotransferase subunit D